MKKYQNLLAQKAALEKSIAQARRRETGKIIKEINALIQQYELSPADLHFASQGEPGRRKNEPRKAAVKRTKAKGPLSPQYRDPTTGKTWSGRGRQPAWIAGDKENYRIAKSRNAKQEEVAATPSVPLDEDASTSQE